MKRHQCQLGTLIQVYSLLTLANSTCETTGHCTEYELQHHYIRVDVTTSGQWGSRLAGLPCQLLPRTDSCYPLRISHGDPHMKPG